MRPPTRRPSSTRRSIAGVGAALALLSALGGCSSSGSSSSSGCGPERREALDPGYLQHVLPGTARQPTYSSDPPTSGPHQPAPPITGVSTKPISKPVQVGLLEAGKVLVQHKGLTAGEVAQLKALAGDKVVVAPADHLPGTSKVVATAWTYKLQCGTASVPDLKTFITAHAGKGPNQR